MQDDRRELVFEGDDSAHAPPLAWTTIWGGTYSNLYGHYIPDAMRKWGYIFWDAKTLKSTGGLELVERQWQDEWDEDPRDDLI